jgi:ribosomal protein S12 methylthiotransferase accessory factor YcaO
VGPAGPPGAATNGGKTMTSAITRILDGTLVLATATAETSDGPFTAGACGFTEQDASVRARSELVERTTLLSEGPRLVVRDPDGGRRVPVIEAPTPATGWVRAEPLQGDETVWLPADLVLLRWHDSRPLPVQQTSVGSAAHSDRDKAIAAGARECLERYAIRRVWSGRAELIRLTGELDDAVPDELSTALRRQGLSASAWLIASVLPVAVVVVMVGSTQRRATFGACCAPTIESGLRHALCEAIGVRAALASSRKLQDSFATPGDEVDHALCASAFQDAFAAFLQRLTVSDDLTDAPMIEAGAVAHLEGKNPVVVDLGRHDDLHIVKVVVPAPEFFVPRRARGYVLNPGYLE